jgi:uncharacterized protein YjiS (DUF1127 family)
MAYAPLDHAVSRPLDRGGLRAGLAAFRTAFLNYRRKRAVYLRTLRELQSYQPHELQDLRIQPADFEELARRQAGLW